jgi:NAD-dependent deacetylase
MSVEIPEQLVNALRKAQQVVVLTGAGVSAESGLSTFRDPQTGLWSKFRPEELATPEAFQRNPKLVWEWYDWRRQKVAEAKPNLAHYALAEIERHVPKFTLITQNIDNFHQAAGSQNVIELHGNLARTKCFEDGKVVESWPPTDEVPPRCPRCGGLLRPDVVWFGEMLPVQALKTAQAEAKACDLFFSIGTSGTVEPAASLPRLARHWVTVVTVNLEVVNSVSERIINLNGKAGEILPALVQKTWPDLF